MTADCTYYRQPERAVAALDLQYHLPNLEDHRAG